MTDFSMLRARCDLNVEITDHLHQDDQIVQILLPSPNDCVFNVNLQFEAATDVSLHSRFSVYLSP